MRLRRAGTGGEPGKVDAGASAAPAVATANDPRYGLTPLIAVAATIAIFFVSQIVAGLIMLPFIHQQDGASTLDGSTTAQFFVVLIVEVVAVSLVLWLLKARKLKPSFIGLVKPKLMDTVYALAGFAVYFPVYQAVYFLSQFLLPNINYNQKQDLGFNSVAGSNQMVLVFISLVILPPIAEEIMMRGLLFSGLRTRLKLLPAMVITSALFAVAHLEFGSGNALLWTAAMDTFILSLVLCFLREKTHSLIPGMILHGLKNCIAFVYLYGMR